MCLEYFGVGFSSTTSRTRSVENYVDEIRMALQRSGFNPPYVLLPHSMSSVYSEYYAASHPDEVVAIISLDGTSSAHYDRMPGWVAHVLQLARVLQAVGLVPLIALLTTNRKKLFSYGYREQEIADSMPTMRNRLPS